MDKEKKARLEARGWRVGSAEELLGLTPEAVYIELRLKLSDAVRPAGVPGTYFWLDRWRQAP